MSGETELNRLLCSMEPVLDEAGYVFCTVSEETYDGSTLRPLGTFREREGRTLILTETQAREAGLAFDSTWAWISLTVHSSLSAVGLLAAITARLAEAGISVNAISAFYHDHLFVPWERRERAMQVLKELSSSAGRKE
jgi:uncharacterized protein